MNITFAPRGILQINDARIVYRNFRGEASKFNRDGDRNFSVVIEDTEIADALVEQGWNVKIRPPRDEDDTPFMHLPVKVKFNERGPNVYLKSGNAVRRLDENSIGCLDRIDILGVDLDIRPYDWVIQEGTPNEKRGRTAYLQGLDVVQDADRFAAKYSDQLGGYDSSDEEAPF